MSTSFGNILDEFFENLESEHLPKDIIDKLKVLLDVPSDINDNDIIDVITKCVTDNDNH
jgi:hypothetical protein